MIISFTPFKFDIFMEVLGLFNNKHTMIKLIFYFIRFVKEKVKLQGF